MANANDSDIIQAMLAMPEEHQLGYFLLNHERIKDDSCYWCTLGVLWKGNGGTENLPVWKALFSSRRRNRQKIMKGRERKSWAKLPRNFTAYRAVNSPEEYYSAVSWTLDKGIAERVFSDGGKRPVVSRIFAREEVFAFFDRRGEEEILVNVGRKG